MINELIDYLQAQIKTISGIDKVYSFAFPDEKEEDNVALLQFIGGNPNNNLCADNMYNLHNLNIFFRGNENNVETLEKVEEIANLLNNQHDVNLTSSIIISIQLTNHIQYAYQDENKRIYYSLDFEINIE